MSQAVDEDVADELFDLLHKLEPVVISPSPSPVAETITSDEEDVHSIEDGQGACDFKPDAGPPTDPAQLVQWASHAAAKMCASELAQQHLRLQNLSLCNENARLGDELADALHRARRLEDSVLLLESQLHAGEEGTKLPLVRGRLLEAATAEADCARAEAADHARAAEAARRELEAYENAAECEKRAMRGELDRLAAQLAQRTLLYHAHERQIRDEQRSAARADDARISELAAEAARAKALDAELRRLRDDSARAAANAAHEHEELAATREDAAARAAEVKQLRAELAQAVVRADDAEAEAERLRRSDVSDIEHDYAAELEVRLAHSLVRRALSFRLDSANCAVRAACARECTSQGNRTNRRA